MRREMVQQFHTNNNCINSKEKDLQLKPKITGYPHLCSCLHLAMCEHANKCHQIAYFSHCFHTKDNFNANAFQ